MITNLISKRNIPAVAYLWQDRFVLSVLSEGRFQLIHQNVVENSDFEGYLTRKPLDIKKGTTLLILLANELVLYSQLKLPLNLSDEEIAALISLQLSQRQQDSKIDTYYDYYRLQILEDSALFGLFEARKDKLNKLLHVFENQGFQVSQIIPQAVVVLNQIIHNNGLTVKKYQIIYRLNDRIITAQIDHENLIGIKQLDIHQAQTDAALYPELLTQLNEFDATEVISLGLDIEQFNQYLSDTQFELTNFGSFSVQGDMAPLTINWVREQYGRDKSVALA